MRGRAWCSRLGIFGLLVFSSTGCEEKQTAKPDSAEKADAGKAVASPAVDPNLAAAVAQVAKEPNNGSQPGKGPPEKGVFAPGAADGEQSLGASPKLTLASDGKDPKVDLGADLVKPGKRREASVQVSVRTGPRSAMPTIDFLVVFDASNPAKGEGKPLIDVIAKVTAAKLANEQPGQLPPGLDAEISKLRGSTIEYKLNEEGGAQDIHSQPSKVMDAGLSRIVDALGEVLATVHVPYPDKPVGEGAYWMVVSREPYAGLDTVAYRMFKVEQLKGDEATLSVNTKRYVAGGQVSFPGIPPHRVDEFEATGRGELHVRRGTGLDSVRLQEVMLTNLEPQGEPGRRVTVQFDVSTNFSFASSG